MRATSLGHALLLVATISSSTAVCLCALAATESYSVANNGASVGRAQRPQLVLNVPATYALQMGSTFDGHRGSVIQPDQVVHLPKLAGGFGVRPGVGVYVQRVAPHLGVMALFSVGWSRHAAKGYNAGRVAYTRDSSALTTTSLELRAIFDAMPVKPFLAIAPGYGWLRLPDGVTVVDPVTRDTHWEDVTLRGFNFAAALGAMYPFNDVVAAEASVGCRWSMFSSSSKGSLSGLGASPALLANLGLTFMF
jgi:hypothetical protein